MRVKNCQKQGCKLLERRVWTQQYKPNGYHWIGINHAYYWCNLAQKRVKDVKNCITRVYLEGE